MQLETLRYCIIRGPFTNDA